MGGDEDAEGSVDDDQDVDDGYLVIEDPDQDAVMSDSETSVRPGKRKLVTDSEEFIRRDPELYGLRRSVRTWQADVLGCADTWLGSCPSITPDRK